MPFCTCSALRGLKHFCIGNHVNLRGCRRENPACCTAPQAKQRMLSPFSTRIRHFHVAGACARWWTPPSPFAPQGKDEKKAKRCGIDGSNSTCRRVAATGHYSSILLLRSRAVSVLPVPLRRLAACPYACPLAQLASVVCSAQHAI